MSEIIGKYEQVEMIGSGGMALIYKGVDPTRNRPVAIKVLRPELAGYTNLVKRFEREAKYTADLDHPHIIPIYEQGHLPDGRPYLVMPWADARSLADWLAHKSRPIPPQRVSAVLTQIAAALDYAHDQQVVHRDVKPSNILLTKKNEVFLSDFGIAKGMKDTPITQAHQRLGTPTYMSPEQIRGQDVTPASDVYALGAILYEMLTMSPPFRGNTESVFFQHLHEDPPPLQTEYGELNTKLNRVLQKALAKEPQARYQKAGQLAKAFEAVIHGKREPLPIMWRGAAIAAGLILLLLGALFFLPSASDLVAGNGTPSTPSTPSTTTTNVASLGTATVSTSVTIISVTSNPVDHPTAVLATQQPETPLPTAEIPLTPPSGRPLTLLAPANGAEFPAETAITLQWAADLITDTQRILLSWRQQGEDTREVPVLGEDYTLTNLSPGTYTWLITRQEGAGRDWRNVDRSLTRQFTILPSPTEVATTPIITPTEDHILPDGEFTLLQPTLRNTVGNGSTIFEWQWTGDLEDNQGFEVRVWRRNEPPRGIHDAVLDQQEGQVKRVGDDTYQLVVSDLLATPSVAQRTGEYFWTVALVQTGPIYADLGVVAEAGRLRIE